MWRVIQGNALDELKKLESESVHCCLTSPPYFGLRSYLSDDDPLKPHELGNERTVEEYVEHMVEVFREMRRVLRRDGVLWLNLGDTYGGNRGNTKPAPNSKYPYAAADTPGRGKGDTVRKQLQGIPWRVAFALQADGWYLRCDVIWKKPNGMPGSQEDRPTRNHEYIFLLTKSGEPQFWTHRDLPGVRIEKPEPDYRWIDHANDDAETDAEPENWRTEEMEDGEKRWSRINLWRGHDYFYDAEAIKEPYSQHSKPEEVYTGQGTKDYAAAKAQNPSDTKRRILESMREGTGRNCRSVWTIPTQPCKFAHFAVMPQALAERCIKAGTSAVGVCAECGAPWARMVEERVDCIPRYRSKSEGRSDCQYGESPSTTLRAGVRDVRTIGWRPTCSCGGDPVPATVLDPFAGAGTTLYVAEKLGRNSIGIELNPSYIEDIIKPRMAEIRYIERPMFA